MSKVFNVEVNDRQYEIQSGTIGQAVKIGIDQYLARHTWPKGSHKEAGPLTIRVRVSERPSVLDVTPEAEAVDHKQTVSRS